jgi:hypothetical protein
MTTGTVSLPFQTFSYLTAFSTFSNGLGSFLAPVDAASTFGILIPASRRNDPDSKSLHNAATSFIRTKGVRDLAIATGYVCFITRKEWRAVRILAGIHCIAGLGDGWIVWTSISQYSDPQRRTRILGQAFGHWMGTIALAGVTAWEWLREKGLEDFRAWI